MTLDMKKQEKMFKIAFYEGTDFKIARKNTVIFYNSSRNILLIQRFKTDSLEYII